MKTGTNVINKQTQKKRTVSEYVNNFNPNISFNELFKQFLEARKNGHTQQKKSSGTLKSDKVRYKMIFEFLSQNSFLKIKAMDFEIKIGRILFDWCRKRYTHNVSVRITQMCRMVLAFGVFESIIKSNPLEHLKLQKTSPGAIIHLVPEEVELLENYRFPAGTWLGIAADLFLFQCYTGLAYADLMTVTKNSIFENPVDGRKYIIQARYKTKNEALIPMFEKTEALWSKYNYNTPKIENSVYNHLLKDIMKFIGVEKRVSTHTARKTFTMIKLNYEGYSVEAVSKMAGHSSIKTTETHYAKVNINRISSELTRLGL